MRHIFAIISLLALIVALFIGVAWFYAKPDYEPALTSLVMLSAIFGLFLERLVSEREKRRQLLKSLLHELFMNVGVAKDIRSLKTKEKSKTGLFLPSFYTTTLTSVIASGCFCSGKDKKLFKLLTSWLQRCSETNALISFIGNGAVSNSEHAQYHYNRMAECNATKMAIESLTELYEYLLNSYSIESEMSHETVLFDT